MIKPAATHSIVFSGHMIDAEGRKEPRFPIAKESVVKQEIIRVLKKIRASTTSRLLGIAGAASGGDILFHESCRENVIPSEIYLGLSASGFEKQSVSPAGKLWEARFHTLLKQLPVHIYKFRGNKTALLASGELWEMANNWMLENAFEKGSMGCSLIVVWDERPGDGRGGTKHMVDEMRRLGHDVHIINPLFL